MKNTNKIRRNSIKLMADQGISSQKICETLKISHDLYEKDMEFLCKEYFPEQYKQIVIG